MQLALSIIALLTAIATAIGAVAHCRRDKAEFRRLNDRR